MKLSLRDVLDKGHWEGEGKYDMINVRALVSVLGDREWEIVLGNLVRGLSKFLLLFSNLREDD